MELFSFNTPCHHSTLIGCSLSPCCVVNVYSEIGRWRPDPAQKGPDATGIWPLIRQPNGAVQKKTGTHSTKHSTIIRRPQRVQVWRDYDISSKREAARKRRKQAKRVCVYCCACSLYVLPLLSVIPLELASFIWPAPSFRSDRP